MQSIDHDWQDYVDDVTFEKFRRSTNGAMPVSVEATRKAASKETRKGRMKAKQIGRTTSGIRQRRRKW